jgi:integrase/recombinase XerD
LQRTQDLLNLGEYGAGTIRGYLSELRYLFSYYVDVRPSLITYEDTINYLIYLNKTFGCSRAKSKMAANSFAFFFRQVQNKPYKIPSILFSAHHGKLPPVMQESEVLAVIQSISNLKHKTVIILLYSTGMRLSEIANLKIADIESKQLRIKIVSGNPGKEKKIDMYNYHLQCYSNLEFIINHTSHKYIYLMDTKMEQGFRHDLFNMFYIQPSSNQG